MLFTSPDFFKGFFVMKCLRSQKRMNASDTTTGVFWMWSKEEGDRAIRGFMV